jgi:hypothetical protein
MLLPTKLPFMSIRPERTNLAHARSVSQDAEVYAATHNLRTYHVLEYMR